MYMCKAFSCVIGRDKTVTWKFGTDSHEDLIKIAGYKDDTLDPDKIEFCRIEISPKNGSYLEPDKWVFKIDMDVTPAWWTLAHKRACEREHKKWKEQLDKVLVRKPIVNPFDITPPEKITDEHIQLVREWASVRDSVRASVWASVWASVGASVVAYMGSFFILDRSEWKYTDRIKCDGYPFQPAVALWELGLVPSFDGRTWRLHGGPDGRVLWEEEI
jgi:hypothetical protein